jgi:hypothetical protein
VSDEHQEIFTTALAWGLYIALVIGLVLVGRWAIPRLVVRWESWRSRRRVKRGVRQSMNGHRITGVEPPSDEDPMRVMGGARGPDPFTKRSTSR